MESDRSCAAVYGPDSLQEKWLGFFPSFLFSWVFVFPSQICTALLHVCLVQSTEHSMAGPNWPLSARKWKELGNTWAGMSHHRQLTGRALPRAAGAAPAQSKRCSGGSWKALMTIHVINVPHHCLLQQHSSPHSSPKIDLLCSPAPSCWIFPTFLASVPARRLSTRREHPPSDACLGLPRKLQPSHSKPLGTDHLDLSLG